MSVTTKHTLRRLTRILDDLRGIRKHCEFRGILTTIPKINEAETSCIRAQDAMLEAIAAKAQKPPPR